MLLILPLILFLGLQYCDSQPLTRVQQGEIVGGWRYIPGSNGNIMTVFMGIPYAKPPIGELRFKPPQEPEPWNGTYVARNLTSCARYRENKVLGSEDCLYLNIFIPRVIEQRIDPTRFNNVSVVVHLHGGSFQAGSPLKSALPDYLLYKKFLIFVTINYRLGPLGFLTDEQSIPGNLGLKDQAMALKWIKNNIEAFGGDPNSITLTGFSAGAMSVHYHYLSPLSKGLFDRGYSISGTALNPRALDKNPLEKTRKFAEKLNCTINEELLKCLQGKTVEELTKNDIEFRPVIETFGNDKFLEDHPYKLINEKKIHDVPWVVSNVVEEAYVLTQRIYDEKSPVDVYENWLEKSPRILEIQNTLSSENVNETLTKLKNYYFGEKLNEDKVEDQLNKLMTDRHYLGPSDLAIRMMSKNMKSPVYYSLSSFVPEDRLQCAGKPTAASHCVDARLIFKWYKGPNILQEKGYEMMLIMARFLKKYADEGVPPVGWYHEKWLPINSSSNTLNVLQITTPDDIKMVEKDELFPRKLWNDFPIMENDKLFPN